MRGNILWTIFLTLCLAILSVAGIFCYENGIHKPVPREIIVKHEAPKEREIIPALPDYSSFTEPVIDRNGKLNIPNNTTISDVSTNTVCTELCEFQIPKAWVDHVVIHVMKMDQKDKELYSDPILNTEVIQFYERETYLKYQSQEYYYSDYANYMGKLCEIYITDNKENETEKIKKNPYEIYFADITKNKKTYSAFLYQFLLNDRVIDPEFEDEYRKLSSVDYQSCIISSFKSDKVDYANSYIKTRYVDGFDPSKPGIDNTDKVKPEKLTRKITKHKADIPEQLNAIEPDPLYEWSEFSSPFYYEDHGDDYSYQPVESGGVPVLTPPTVTPTPEPEIEVGTENVIDMGDTSQEIQDIDDGSLTIDYSDQEDEMLGETYIDEIETEDYEDLFDDSGGVEIENTDELVETYDDEIEWGAE